jgi:S1-C subfamily serine protease
MFMTRADWLALAFVALAAAFGLRRGLIGSALSLVGIVAGAILGGRLAPHILAGSDSPYTPVVALAGAVVGAFALELVGALVTTAIRRSLTPRPVQALDAAGGFALGAAAGLAIVWVAGAVALYLPGRNEIRRDAQRSLVLKNLNDVVAPDRVIRAIQRVDPFPSIAGPVAPVEAPDPNLLESRGVRLAQRSVVRVLGDACGLAVSGSGWAAGDGLVVTAAHVVAGQENTLVQHEDRRASAVAVAFDPRNDVAVLRLEDPLELPPLRLGDGAPGTPVAILGFPEGGPLSATAGRIGRTARIVSEDAYGRGPVVRGITSLRGHVRHGHSGGPAVDVGGDVETMVFAARRGARGGFGVPSAVIRDALASAREPVPTGDCAP